MNDLWTPGEPWHISRDRFGVKILRQHDGSPFPDRSPEAIEARDAVIEAAPVLLAVCEAFVAPFSGFSDGELKRRAALPLHTDEHFRYVHEIERVLAMRAALKLKNALDALARGDASEDDGVAPVTDIAGYVGEYLNWRGAVRCYGFGTMSDIGSMRTNLANKNDPALEQAIIRVRPVGPDEASEILEMLETE